MEPKSTHNNSIGGKSKSTHAWVRPFILVFIILSMFLLARFFGLGEKIGELRTWIESLGPVGMVVFVFIYIAATVAAVPGSAITVAAGALFGSVFGVILVSISSTAGATLCFLISRYFARNAIAQWLSTKKTFIRLDKLTEEHGAVIVALTRLVPIFPFNILNYGFGVTSVKLKDYVFWSWICMLPGTILFVVGADAVTKAFSQGKIPWPLLGLAAGMIVILYFLVKYARKKLVSKEESLHDEKQS